MTDAKTLRVTLDIQVRALDGEELEDAQQGMPEVEDEGGPEQELEEADASELADIVAGMFHSETIKEAFAGSNMFLTFDERPEVIDAEWVDETS